MAIILKNNLTGLVTYATNTPAGSGTVEPNGGTAVMPDKTSTIAWTVQKDVSPGSFLTTEKIAAKDGQVYTLDVTSHPI